VASVDVESNDIFIGAYGRSLWNKLNFSGTLLGGVQNHITKRNVWDNINGVEVAKASYRSFSLGPSMSIWTNYNLGDGFHFRPQAHVNVSATQTQGYRENNSTNSNLMIKSPLNWQATARIEAAGTYAFADQSGFLEIRTGVTNQMHGSQNTKIVVQNASFKYSKGSSRVLDGFIGTRANYHLTENL
jgi:hypothetical protein